MKLLKMVRECAGQCGGEIEYEVRDSTRQDVFDGYAPDVKVVGGNVMQYAGGHLCFACAEVVEKALESRKRPDAGPRRKWKQAGYRWNQGGLKR